MKFYNQQKLKFVIIIISFFINKLSYSQLNNSLNKNNWFTSLDIGYQMSGIKKVDFVKDNYSPLFRLTIGKHLNKTFGIQVSYQGEYFNTIADKERHYYDFYAIEGLVDVKKIISRNNKNNVLHQLIFHAGFGFFKNHYYNDSSIHYILGGANLFKISKTIETKVGIGAVAGWDIYQGDLDILPYFSTGIIYNFKTY